MNEWVGRWRDRWIGGWIYGWMDLEIINYDCQKGELSEITSHKTELENLTYCT